MSENTQNPLDMLGELLKNQEIKDALKEMLLEESESEDEDIVGSGSSSIPRGKKLEVLGSSADVPATEQNAVNATKNIAPVNKNKRPKVRQIKKRCKECNRQFSIAENSIFNNSNFICNKCLGK